MRRKGRLKNTPRKKEEYVGEPERDLRGIIQAQNMKINAAKWEHHLQESCFYFVLKRAVAFSFAIIHCIAFFCCHGNFPLYVSRQISQNRETFIGQITQK